MSMTYSAKRFIVTFRKNTKETFYIIAGMLAFIVLGALAIIIVPSIAMFPLFLSIILWGDFDKQNWYQTVSTMVAMFVWMGIGISLVESIMQERQRKARMKYQENNC